jgi:hypothetical protein
VAPVVVEVATGTVIGIGVLQLFPPAVYTLILSILAPFAEVVYVILGLQRSRVCRLRKACARSSCLSVLMGQVVLHDISKALVLIG